MKSSAASSRIFPQMTSCWMPAVARQGYCETCFTCRRRVVSASISIKVSWSKRQDFPNDPRLSLINAPLLEHTRPEGGYAAILCVGSTHAFGSFEECLRVAFDWLKPNGRLLVADGYWKQAPSQDYLDAIGGTADEFVSHAQNAQRANALGYNLLRTATSSDDEWDEYEGRYCDAMMQYLATHPDDPDSAKFLKRMQDWHNSYLLWGRATLGFGYYLLSRT
jgi:SAM-dependent methyltransferase